MKIVNETVKNGLNVVTVVNSYGQKFEVTTSVQYEDDSFHNGARHINLATTSTTIHSIKHNGVELDENDVNRGYIMDMIEFD